jgi:internalin A
LQKNDVKPVGMKTVRESLIRLIIALAACLSGTAVAQVSFPDPNLETAVRSALSLPGGTVITQSNLVQLASLQACCANITNLLGLQAATNLTSLDVSGNLIRDLAPLIGLTKLTNLNVGGNLITNLTPLAGLTKLNGLWLYGNPIPNVAPVANLSLLNSLVLYNTRLENLSPLSGLTNLKYLELRCNPLTNLATLSGLTNLTTLYLGGTVISNLTFLQNLKRLAFLNLDHSQIRDISPLTTLPALTGLDLSYNPLTNISQIATLSNLTSLNLSGNSISNLSAFSSLTGLVSVTLFENRISDLTPLAGRTNLLDLGLSWNPNVNLAPLAGLTNLTALWLDGDSVSNLAFVQGFKSLKALGLRQNRMTDLGALTALTNLQVVFGDFNRLTNISGVQGLRPARLQVTGNLLDLSSNSPAMNTIQTLVGQGASVVYLPQNKGPTISAPSSWNIATNTTSSLNFRVGDDTTPGSPLIVTASSSNPALIPDASISTAVFGINGQLTLTPAPNLSGSASILLTVTDQAGSSTNVSVLVNVMVPQPVNIPDPNLRAAIRVALNKIDLTNLDLESLTQLIIEDKTVRTLAGLQAATNLLTLALDNTGTTNFAALTALKRLSYLELENMGLTDVPALAELTSLTALALDGNSISNLNFLENLTGLIYLSIGHNRITDIEPLVYVYQLGFLSMKDNLATDLYPILNLSRLSYLDARVNILNTAPGSGSMLVIQNLATRGSTIKYLPQRGPPDIDAPKVWVMDTGVTSSLYFSIVPNGFLDEVTIGAASTNTTLLPNSSLAVTGQGDGWWKLSMTPAADLTGASRITLTVTNDLGFSNRWDISVTVASAQPFNGQSVNPAFVWHTGANAPWGTQTAVTHDGISAADSGTAEDGEISWIQATLQGPGKLAFWWRISSETNEDYLEIYIDGALRPPGISGEVDWERRVEVIPTLGTHVVRWQYSKDYNCCADGDDTGWIDDVTFTPLPWIELISRTNNQCQLLLHTTASRLYDLEVSTNLTSWTRLTRFVPTNSVTAFVDGIASVNTRYFRLHEYQPEEIRLDQFKRIGTQVRMTLLSPPGLQFEMQTSTNLAAWTSLGFVTNSTGALNFTNLPPANPSRRFYRARMLPL